jgi:hypothetical protein
LGSVIKSENLRPCDLPLAGPFVLDLILITDYEGAPYSPEQLIVLMDQVGHDNPTFKRALAAFEAWEEGQTHRPAAPSASDDVAVRNSLNEFFDQEEQRLDTMLPDAMPLLHSTDNVLTIPKAPAASKRAPKPCPAVSDITMIQTTLWDNWGSEKRPKSGGHKDRKPMNRFGCDIEVWTDAGATISNIADLRKKLAFRSRTDLIRWQDFGAIPPKLVAEGKITQDYADELLGLHASSLQTFCFGLFSGRGAAPGAKGGGGYIPRTFMMVEMLGPIPDIAELWVNGQRLRVQGWTDKTPGGEPLASYRASRMDIEGSYGWKGWDSRL